MAQPSKKLTLGSEFDAFLFAPIGQEKNGMLLTVLSALARLDIDPWREAAELARMPKGAANRRVTSMIAGLEIASTAPLEPETVAARLITLLPRGVRSSSGLSEQLPAGGVGLSSRAILCVVLLNLLLVVAMVGAQRAAVIYSPPVKLDIPQASTASKPPLGMSLPRSSE